MQIRLIGLVLVAGCKLAGTPAAQPAIATVRDEAHVCSDGNRGALAVGMAVRFVHSTCRPLNAKSSVIHCTPSAIGDGEIVRVDGACAEVRLRSGAVLATGDRVELVAR
ncbi:MAG TPA: hypothetical protein VHB97_20455 [Polyangia bacterium]|jgi:hypothetical protein|nr:hypothetical protein [Polyangia bacterium]